MIALFGLHQEQQQDVGWNLVVIDNYFLCVEGLRSSYHHLSEAVKLSFADRDGWLADPRYADIPLDRLISKEYAQERRNRIDRDSSMEMGKVKSEISIEAEQQSTGGGDTCYFTVVDERGMVASVIQSIFHEFGSAEIGGDTGVLLQNRGAGFKLDENNLNGLKLGKRPFIHLLHKPPYGRGRSGRNNNFLAFKLATIHNN